MQDLFALIEAVGPVMGLLLFAIMKQIQVGNMKPRLVSIEAKLDLLIAQREVKPMEVTIEPIQSDDSGCHLPTEEAVR
jgi:hypothetical protein